MEAFFQPKLAVVLGCFFCCCCLFVLLCAPPGSAFVGPPCFISPPLLPSFFAKYKYYLDISKGGRAGEKGTMGAPPWPFSVSEASSPPCQPQSRNAKQLLPAPRVLGRGVTSGWCLLGCAWEGDFCKGCAEHKRRI